MIKRISVLVATLACVSLNAMETGGRKEHVITGNPVDFLEPHYGRAEQLFARMDLSQFPVITEVGVMTGFVAKNILAKQAPKSEITAIVRADSPFAGHLEGDKGSGVNFKKQDIRNVTLEKPTNLLIFLGQLPYENNKKGFIENLAKNIAPNGLLVTTCVTPNNSSLIKAFLEVKEDPRWKSDLDKIDINKIWMPAPREEIEDILNNAGLAVKKVELDESPVIFKNRETFKLFVSAVTSGIKARISDSQTLNNKEQLDTYLETLTQTYLKYHPAREDGTVEYHIPEHIFVARKN